MSTHTFIFPVSQKEQVKGKLIVSQSMSFDELCQADEGYNTPTIKDLYAGARDDEMIMIVAYESLDGEIRHRIGKCGLETNDLNVVESIANSMTYDLKINIKINSRLELVQ